MVTYNHEKYIKEAIESVLIQKTNFDYEIVIGEDCSVDKTREIVMEYVRKYPDRIKVILNKKNLGMIHNFINTLKNCKGKYIAMLEGDDYWIDPYKLQKQVDFLESHPDYGLIHTDYNIWHEKNGKFIKSVNKNRYIPTDNFYEELLIDNFICTATVCGRTFLIHKALNEIGSNFYKWMQGDRTLWTFMALYSRIGYIDDITAVHRVLKESAQHSKNRIKNFEFFKSSYANRFYYINKHGCSEKNKRIVLNNYHRGMLKHSFNLRITKLAKAHYLNIAEVNNENKFEYLLYYLGSINLLFWIFIKIYFKIRRIFYSIRSI